MRRIENSFRGVTGERQADLGGKQSQGEQSTPSLSPASLCFSATRALLLSPCRCVPVQMFPFIHNLQELPYFLKLAKVLEIKQPASNVRRTLTESVSRADSGEGAAGSGHLSPQAVLARQLADTTSQCSPSPAVSSGREQTAPGGSQD